MSIDARFRDTVDGKFEKVLCKNDCSLIDARNFGDHTLAYAWPIDLSGDVTENESSDASALRNVGEFQVPRAGLGKLVARRRARDKVAHVNEHIASASELNESIARSGIAGIDQAATIMLDTVCVTAQERAKMLDLADRYAPV